MLFSLTQYSFSQITSTSIFLHVFTISIFCFYFLIMPHAYFPLILCFTFTISVISSISPSMKSTSLPHLLHGYIIPPLHDSLPLDCSHIHLCFLVMPTWFCLSHNNLLYLFVLFLAQTQQTALIIFYSPLSQLSPNLIFSSTLPLKPSSAHKSSYRNILFIYIHHYLHPIEHIHGSFLHIASLP